MLKTIEKPLEISGPTATYSQNYVEVLFPGLNSPIQVKIRQFVFFTQFCVLIGSGPHPVFFIGSWGYFC